MATAFNTQGAVPQTPKLPGLGGVGYTPSTSAGKALNTAMGGNQPPKAPAIPAAAPAPTNQPIKKQTVTTAGGDTHTTEYHPPTPTATYPGIINSLADTSQKGNSTAQGAAQQLSNTPAGTPAAQGYIKQTAGYGAGNLDIGQKAAEIATQYGKQIADVGGQGARFEAGQLTTGTSPVAEGNAAVTAQTTAAQQQALATGEEAALQGTAQQLTGQNQAANAANEAAGQSNTAQSNQITGQNAAGGIANTAQGQRQSGLIGAGQLAQPQLGNIGQVPYSPTTLEQGSPLGAPGGTAADAARVSGQFQGAQAAAAAGGQAEAQNTIAQGTAGTKSWNDIYAKANDQYATYSAQQSAINGVANQVLELMNQKDAQGNPIINPTSSQFANTKLNQLQTQFSSPQYSAFNTAIQSLQARIGQALQAGEIPTAATGNAQKIADGSLNLGALASTLQQVDKEMGTFVSTQKSLADYAKNQLGTNSGQGSRSTQGGSIQSNSVFSW